MKLALAKVFVVVAGIIACLQWSQIAYRLALFYYQCNGERGFNHIDDGAFGVAYLIDGVVLVLGIVVLFSFRKNPGFWRACTLAFVLANITGGITLFNMHRTGVLVGYGEFIWNWQHSGQTAPQDDLSWISYDQAKEAALEFISQNGFKDIHITVEELTGRFPEYQFATNGIMLPLKIMVDRKSGKVGYDYSRR
jgi:hypothetical protein